MTNKESTEPSNEVPEAPENNAKPSKDASQVPENNVKLSKEPPKASVNESSSKLTTEVHNLSKDPENNVKSTAEMPKEPVNSAKPTSKVPELSYRSWKATTEAPNISENNAKTTKEAPKNFENNSEPTREVRNSPENNFDPSIGIPQAPENKKSQAAMMFLSYINHSNYTHNELLARHESLKVPTPKISIANLPFHGTAYIHPKGLNSYFSQVLHPNNATYSGPLSGPKFLDFSDSNNNGYNKPNNNNNSSRARGSGSNSIKTNSNHRVAHGSAAELSDSIEAEAELQMLYNKYERPYLLLQEYMDKSIDLYKPEIRRVMYPIFVHIYLSLAIRGYLPEATSFFEENAVEHAKLHYRDLKTLCVYIYPLPIPSSSFEQDEQIGQTGPSGPSQMRNQAQNPEQNKQHKKIARIFKSKKYILKMSRTVFDLLINFLLQNFDIGGGSIVEILCKHIQLKITTARPSHFFTKDELDPEEGFPGLWKPNAQKLNGITKQNGNKVQNVVNGSQEEYEQNKTLNESHILSAVPIPDYKEVDIQAEITKIRNSRGSIRIQTPQFALPSVCMYTFQNDGNTEINNLAFSKNSKLVAAGCMDSSIKVWSLEGGDLKKTKKKDEKIYERYNDDDDENQVKEHTNTSMLSRRLIGHSGAVYGLSFSPDNSYLLSSSCDKTVRLWSTDTYKTEVSYKGHTGSVWDVSFCPFGQYFATASHDQTARLWSCDHVNPLRIFAGHLNDLNTVTFHPNSTFVATGSSDKSCKLWDINSGNNIRTFINGHNNSVSSIAVSPDGRWLASADQDSLIIIWDIGTGHRLKTMSGHRNSSIYSLDFSGDGSALVSSGADCTVRVWDTRKATTEKNPEPIAVYTASTLSKQNVISSGNGNTNGVNWPNTNTNGGQNSINGANGPHETLTPNENKRPGGVPVTRDHMAVFNTKKTPVYRVQYTEKNVCLAGGVLKGSM